MPKYTALRHQTCMWYSDIYAGETLTYINNFKYLKGSCYDPEIYQKHSLSLCQGMNISPNL